jgi:MinD-like ATPase involved in chromosome partitioning or flagellar assembly/tetratricopeptide (TPR) repeat protein
MKPFWITFYSYKGGVGRSLALANIAALLVKRGRRVVLIDFDLEAPGLDSFKEFNCIAAKPGVVEYVTAYKQAQAAPDIAQFIHPCALPGPLRGKLWIMPAGRKDTNYNAARANINWVDLYENHHGELFVENWKAAISHHFRPDYVLVDSRTGLTDVGGICTLHLPDLVVMLFGLNDQNIHGVAAVAKTIRESDTDRVPQVHYVASPIPNLPRDKGGALTKRWAEVTKAFGTNPESTIRYQAIAALSERLFVLDEHSETLPIVGDYAELLGRLIEYNRNGLDSLSNQVEEAVEAFDKSRIERLLAVLETEYPDRADSFALRSQLNLALDRPGDAKILARKALSMDPSFREPFDWLLEQLQREGELQSALALCNTLLQDLSAIPPRRLNDIHSVRGEIAMAVCDYQTARSSYEFCFEQARKFDRIPPILLMRTFNLLESTRRCSGTPSSEGWNHVIRHFLDAGEATHTPPTVQANNWQAMHIAFAMTGDLNRAKEALLKAHTAASRVGRAEDIFSPKTYRLVSVDEFLKINDEMLAALDKGQLWDGMPLPTTENPKASHPNPQ